MSRRNRQRDRSRDIAMHASHSKRVIQIGIFNLELPVWMALAGLAVIVVVGGAILAVLSTQAGQQYTLITNTPQPTPTPTPVRILFMLDGSSLMATPLAEGETRWQVALEQLASQLLLYADWEIGVLVYGPPESFRAPGVPVNAPDDICDDFEWRYAYQFPDFPAGDLLEDIALHPDSIPSGAVALEMAAYDGAWWGGDPDPATIIMFFGGLTADETLGCGLTAGDLPRILTTLNRRLEQRNIDLYLLGLNQDELRLPDNEHVNIFSLGSPPEIATALSGIHSTQVANYPSLPTRPPTLPPTVATPQPTRTPPDRRPEPTARPISPTVTPPNLAGPTADPGGGANGGGSDGGSNPPTNTPRPPQDTATSRPESTTTIIPPTSTPTATLSPSPRPSVTPTATASSTPTATAITIPTGVITPQPTGVFTPPLYGVIRTDTGESARVRSGPGGGYPILGALPVGTAVVIYAEVNEWYLLAGGGLTGWVWNQLVLIGGDPTEQALTVTAVLSYTPPPTTTPVPPTNTPVPPTINTPQATNTPVPLPPEDPPPSGPPEVSISITVHNWDGQGCLATVQVTVNNAPNATGNIHVRNAAFGPEGDVYPTQTFPAGQSNHTVRLGGDGPDYKYHDVWVTTNVDNSDTLTGLSCPGAPF